MSSVAKKTAKQIFNHGIVTTFGKLDAIDIENVDGQPDQLVTLLVKKYGWSRTDAKHRVDLFTLRLSNNPQ